MRLILQSLCYMEESWKLLTGPLVKPRTHTFGSHSPSIFQEELLSTAEHILTETVLLFREYFIKKLSYLVINTSIKSFCQIR